MVICKPVNCGGDVCGLDVSDSSVFQHSEDAQVCCIVVKLSQG